MSFANPTPLRVGMTGLLGGTRYRVAGRVVVGMEEAGETYYWNEFHLVDEAGDAVTLVYEETEHGGEWKLFTLFEPPAPLSAAAAAAKQVGETLLLEGQRLRVTLVDESRVYHIEGEAPEGVEVGDVARYFNAEAGDKMIVVSWTGEEVEYYRGVTLPRGVVAAAFGLPADVRQTLLPRAAEGRGGAPASAVLRVVLTVWTLALAFGWYSSCHSLRERVTRVKRSAPPALLTLGSAGVLEGRGVQVVAHRVVEIGQVGRVFDRHEYELAAEDGSRRLLVQGWTAGANDWALFSPLAPVGALTPERAATLRVGERVNLGGYVAPVTELFQTVVRQAEGRQPPGSQHGVVFFGFTASAKDALLLARWNQQGIGFYRGRILSGKEAEAAFRPKERNPDGGGPAAPPPER